jgi:tetratricopeptide (TPR) repeat protein
VESIAQPLRRLQEEAAWFARASELRLLWVQTEAALRSTATSVTERLEYHADNRSPFIILDAPWSGPDLGARARNTRFVEQFAQKAQAQRDAGLDLPAFEGLTPDHPNLETFAHNLRLACAVLRPPLSGLVVVLAPPRVDDREAFLLELSALCRSKTLKGVRWIVIETDTRYLEPLCLELGEEQALAADFRIDEAEQQKDVASLAGPTPATGALPVMPFPWGPWSSGGAMPDALAPARLDDRQPPSDEQLQKSGLQPAYLKGGARELRRLMLGAALALRQQRFEDAIDLQTQSAELCGNLHLYQEQVIQLLVLGGYLLAAAIPARAHAVYQKAADLAAHHQLPMQQAQAELGLGMLAAMAAEPEAMTHYATAARLSEQAQAIPLALECWRMAGQCAEEHGALERAIECWRRALTLSDALSPEVKRTTSAADIARLLANAEHARGHHALADEGHRKAFEIEHGVPPGALLAQPRPLPPEPAE